MINNNKVKEKAHNNSQNAGILERLYGFGEKTPEEVLRIFRTSQKGLSEKEVLIRRKESGKNIVDYEKPPAWWVQLLQSFLNPFILILVVLVVVSYIMDVLLAEPANHDFTKIIILSIMVVISVSLRFWQEFTSQKTVEKLKSLVQNKSAVIRADGSSENIVASEIFTADIVPGDIVELSAGDMVPGDIRLIESDDLFISQSTLTGESMPVEKYAHNSTKKTSESAFDIPTICLMGTTVTSGYGKGVVVGTGKNTYFGSMAKQIVGKRPMTSFDKGINKVSIVLIVFMLIMVPIVFLLNWWTKGSWQEALFFGIAIAVGLTPEMLPLVVTSNLAKGSIKMAKRKVIVKKLNAIQNFGAMDVLCTDKTGTITENRIVLIRHLDAEGHHSETVLRLAQLNSYYQTGLKSLMDKAILNHSNKLDADKMLEYEKIDEIPFDFSRRRMSIVLEKKNSARTMICKGAVEEIFEHCTKVNKKGKIVPLDEVQMKDIIKIKTQLNMDGLRVIAISYKDLPRNEGKKQYSVDDENDLIFAGYIAFLDPPKESAQHALRLLQEKGIHVKVITGDNEIVTQKICRDVNLQIKGVLTSSEIDRMTEEELSAAVEHTTIFAKIGPLQKAKIISVLKKNNHVVGYLGDGVNDAAALKEADVGISVNTGADIAKEAADIILTEHDLLVLETGVEEGRNIFGNISKYIKMTASSNFGNVFSILVASVFLPFLPMLPIQLLVQNLLYDTSQLSIPWDRMDKEYLRKPKRWDASNLVRFIIWIGPISSIFDIITFGVLWYIIGANTVGSAAVFQSGWFVEGLISQTLIVHMIRTEKIPFIQSRASTPVLITTGLIIIAGITIPFTVFGHLIGLQPMPAVFYVLLVGILLSYCILAQLVKTVYIKRYREWL